jgi:hypothetical protein
MIGLSHSHHPARQERLSSAQPNPGRAHTARDDSRARAARVADVLEITLSETGGQGECLGDRGDESGRSAV